MYRQFKFINKKKISNGKIIIWQRLLVLECTQTDNALSYTEKEIDVI